jgi:hypothetical protein
MDMGQGLLDAWQSIVGFVPLLLGFLVILVLGWIIAWFVGKAVAKGLHSAGLDRALHRGGVAQYFENSRWTASELGGKIFYYVGLLFVLTLAFNVFGPNPVSTLLNDVIADERWDMTYLGMQVIIEGLALAAFSLIRDFSQEPLAKAINTYVMQDEARHVAFGRLALRDYYPQLTRAERDEREEFVVEACYLMRNRFMAQEVWERLGLDVERCMRYVEEADLTREFRTMLFSRIVPTVKDIGLWGPKVQKAYRDLGVLQYQLEEEPLLQRMGDVLRPSGVLVVTGPTKRSLPNGLGIPADVGRLLRRIGVLRSTRPPSRPQHRYSVRRFQRLLRAAWAEVLSRNLA